MLQHVPKQPDSFEAGNACSKSCTLQGETQVVRLKAVFIHGSILAIVMLLPYPDPTFTVPPARR